MNGESPTRPAGLNGIPPVDVPAARFAGRGRARSRRPCRARTASRPSSGRGAPSAPPRSRVRGRRRGRPGRRSRRRPARRTGARRRPVNTANGLSRTRRASVIACGTPRTDDDRADPQRLAVHDPGIELDEALLAQRGPRPAPKMPEPSSSRTARSTASSAVPPSSSTCQPARAAARQPSRWTPCSGGAMSKAPPWTAMAGLPPSSHVASISPMAPVDLRPWPVIARTTVPLASRATADRARPACAAADVGSTKIPCDSSVRSEARISSSVTSTISPPVARMAARIWRRARRAVDADALGDRRPGVTAMRRRFAGAERQGQRRARGALDADEARMRSISPAARSRSKPRWTPSSSVPPPSGATTTSGARPPSCSKTS